MILEQKKYKNSGTASISITFKYATSRPKCKTIDTQGKEKGQKEVF
jgi:hypothetical protein